MHSAMSEAKASTGISSALIACFLRNLGPEAAMETLEGLIAAHRCATATLTIEILFEWETLHADGI